MKTEDLEIESFETTMVLYPLERIYMPEPLAALSISMLTGFPHVPRGRNWVMVAITKQCSLFPTPVYLNNLPLLQGPPESFWSQWAWLSCAHKLVSWALLWFLPVLLMFYSLAQQAASPLDARAT